MKFEDEEQKAYRPRPSMAGPERCIRQMAYMSQGVQGKRLPGRALVVFDDGRWHEELSLDLLRQSAFTPHSEQMGVTLKGVLLWMPRGEWHCDVCGGDFSNQDIHGHIDACVVSPLGEDFLLEHKAYSFFSVEAILRGELPLDALTQMGIYFRGIQQDTPDLRRGLLLIKNKNNGGYVEFLCMYDTPTDTLVVVSRTDHNGEIEVIDHAIPNITMDAFERFRKVEECRASGTLPGRQYDRDHWRCQYCLVSDRCWSGWAESHQELATEAVLDDEIVTLLKYEREKALYETEAKGEREALRKNIKEILKAKGVREGRAGDYLVEWTVENKKKFDKSLLPPEIIRRYSVEKPYERLIIRRIGEEIPGGRDAES